MAKFPAQFLKPVSSTTVGIASIETAASTPRRIKLLEMWIGSDAGTLGTSDFRFDLNRITGVAAGTSVTIAGCDPADITFTSVVRSNLTANGTGNTTVALTIPLSQQATVRWVANPGSELIVPAVNSNGFNLNTPVSGNTPSVAGTFLAEEQ